jgi:type II secretory pathway component PulF
MAQYRCKFLDAKGRMLCTEDVEAETDQQALEKVRSRFAPVRNAFELWREDTRVHAEGRKARERRLAG